ncbi:tRNA uridine-5-carboxymethylaminomethyl(34) synthesis GTPase MnmE [bacterium D16-51]|nr:tRNA uridine-5-carboxymethylaminomethyl(34) synthesis GTPase MnmE [bacterium D16-59]RKI60395.1 tRNA uridine-5-carboxymethylaminomethyl(34) synthesis GTPase MnmE [bacterium D16-51]
MQQDTIAGIASGMGGGIGIIRISGENAFLAAGEIFRTRKFIKIEDENRKDIKKTGNSKEWDSEFFLKKESHTIHYGYIIEDDGSIIDEVIVLLMRGPKSYTCEDVVEIDSHGGAYLVQKILKLLIRHGARLAEPGEFTKRAFLNGRIDLSQAEAVMKMISSKNEFALESAVNQLEGRVSGYIENIRQEILHHMGYIEAALDDPEHYDLENFSEELYGILQKKIASLKGLLSRFENGRMKSEGIHTVIVGKPNVGKSSLMNLLLDEERAIVTNIAGTTRDILEETVQIGNLNLNLIDTAGIHETGDIVESLGVEKAKEYLNQADFILFVVDVSQPLEESDDKIISLISGKKGIILLNKSDLSSCVDEEELKNKLGWDCISFSNKTGSGLKKLEDYITNSFLKGDIAYNDQIYLTSIRHREAVENAVKSLEQVLVTIEGGMPEDLYIIDMMDAYQKLGLINGETASEDLVNKIFSDFCMGK